MVLIYLLLNKKRGENSVYKKMKKILKNSININASFICDEILKLNPDIFLAISKKYLEKEKKLIENVTDKIPTIISSVPVNELIIPSHYKLIDNLYLTFWYDNEVIAKIDHKIMKFYDGNIKQRKIHNLYLDIQNDEPSLKITKTS